MPIDYRNMPLRKPIALWSIVLAGVLTVILMGVWIVWYREPPSGFVSIIIALISVPPAAYMGTSVYQSVRTPQPQQPERRGHYDYEHPEGLGEE